MSDGSYFQTRNSSFVDVNTDKVWLQKLATHVEECRKMWDPLVPGGTNPSELRRRVGFGGRVGGRRDDWKLTERTAEHDARLALVVSRWLGEGYLPDGLQFVAEMELDSRRAWNDPDELDSYALEFLYKNQWAVMAAALTNLQKGKYSCGTCFDTKKVVVLHCEPCHDFGDGCGRGHYTDVAGSRVKSCPTCYDDSAFPVEC